MLGLSACVVDAEEPTRDTRSENNGKADALGSCESTSGDFCDEQSAEGCWCDSQCTDFGDCCSDRAVVCEGAEPTPEPTPEPEAGSCNGSTGDFCGGKSSDGCWCDSECAGFGDCCDDIGPICETPAPTPPVGACPGVAQYRVTLQTNWNVSGVPNPHWSPLIGGTHLDTKSFWSEGEIATNGIEVMAETGGTAALRSEVQSAVSAGTANQVLQGSPIQAASGQTSLVFSTNNEFSSVTLVSMMAPSPDWFVGVDGISLCGNGQWVEGSVNMVLFDSGTDNGVSNTSGDSNTSPAAPIGRAAPFVQNGSSISLGTMTFELL